MSSFRIWKFAIAVVAILASAPAMSQPIADIAKNKDLQEVEAFYEKYYKDYEGASWGVDRSGTAVRCVSVDKQPALKNPLLAGHEVQLEPSKELKAILKNVKERTAVGACPNGQIGMLLPTRGEMVAAGSLKKFLSKPAEASRNLARSTAAPPAVGFAGHQYAVSRMYASLIGAQSTVNLWKPTVAFTQDFSLSQLWVYGGANSALQTVEVGVHVYPYMYGGLFNPSYDPRVFIFYTPDNYSTGCYNLRCPAFVQTDPSVTIGGVLTPVSTPGGYQAEGTVAYYRDPTTGNWILFQFDGVNYLQIGYYPKSLFNNGQLSKFAQGFDVGGEIYDALVSGAPTQTDMGSGYFPAAGYRYAAYHRNVKYMKQDGTIANFVSSTLQSTKPGCYSASHGTDPSWGYSLFFGGPGYNSSSCTN